MKRGPSLFIKILLWFFLNIFVLAAVAVGVLNIRPQLPPDSPFGLWTGGRFPTAVHLVSMELSESNPEDWTGILQKFSKTYKVDFSLLLDDGSAYFGPAMDLPQEVVQAVQAQLIPQRQPGFIPPKVDEPPEFLPPVRESEISGPPRNMGFNPPPPDFFNGRPPKPRHFFLRTSNPTRYWLGAPILVMSERLRMLRPAVLIAVSDSVTGEGVFFDPWPWVTAAAAAVLISFLLWWPFVRHITKPLAKMTQAADRIAQGRFDVRLDEKRKDEIGRLAKAVNDMSDQLSRFIQGQKRFLGDAAHELASPIARIQLGLGILENRGGSEVDDHLQGVIEEVGHMSKLVNELLSFSRAEAGAGKVSLQPTRAAEVIHKAVDREIPEGTEIRLKGVGDQMVLAEPGLLGRALANLLRNAVRFASHAGPIVVQVAAEGEKIRISVQDSGPGVPEEDLTRLFEPFYRPEASRRRETGGVGLGLSIVKTCIQACGGEVACRNLKPSGFVVDMFLTDARAVKPEA